MNLDNLTIDKINGTVAFNEEVHKYWDINTKQLFTSVTTLVGQFEQPYDKEFWSSYKALEKLTGDEFISVKPALLKTKKFSIDYIDPFNLNVNDFNKAKEEILAQWAAKNKQSCDRGTAYHLVQEEAAYVGENKFIQDHINECCEVPFADFIVEKGNYDLLSHERYICPEYLAQYSKNDFFLAGQADVIIRDGNYVDVLDYKGLPLDTPIPTPDGFVLMKDIKVGQKVFDINGNLCKVSATSQIHNNPCYKITLDTGEEIIADHEHKWPISFRRNNKSFREEVLTTKEIFNKIETINRRSSSLLPRIKVCGCINLPQQNLPIDPYVLGCWLGDGHKQSGAMTNINNDVWQEIQNRGYEIGQDISGKNRAETHTILGISTNLRKLGLLDNKHIPMMYLRASKEQRIDLLRGLMDTDGYYNPKRNRYVMNTTQLWQAEGIHTLLRSLGVKSTLINTYASFNGKRVPAYNVCFYSTISPFLVRDCVSNRVPKCNYSSHYTIKKVEKVDTVLTKCIMVDSPTHTFLFGKEFIPTHNTNEKMDMKSYFNPRAKKTERMKFPLGKLDDCNYIHYCLQLSTYAYMIKLQTGLEPRHLKLIHHDHEGKDKIIVAKYMEKEVIAMLKQATVNKAVKSETERLMDLL